MNKPNTETFHNTVSYAKKTLAIENLYTNNENFRFTQEYLNGTMSSSQAINEMKKYNLNKQAGR